MKNNRMKAALENIARAGIPENTNLMPSITARIEKEKMSMKPGFRLTWSFVLAILALILATSVAYALYRYFADPGLQSVNEAGMITDLNSTAQPNLLPPGTPDGSLSFATIIDEQQTQNDVQITLDWIYLLDGQQTFHISSSGLPTGTRFGMPEVVYADVIPEQYSGAIFSLDDDLATSGLYVSNQIIRKNGQFGGQVDVRIDIPLLENNIEINRFSFNLEDVSVIVPNGGGGGDSFSVRVNGVDMRLVHSIVAPSYTAARVCYEMPSQGKDWVADNITVEFGDEAQVMSEPVTVDTYTQVSDENNERCADISFPKGKSVGDTFFIVKVENLTVTGTQEQYEGPWAFYTSFVDASHVPGLISATSTSSAPIDSKTVGDLTAVLEWAYVDANRVAYTVHFDGWQESYFLSMASLRDENGGEINSSFGSQNVENDPTTFTLDFTPAERLTGERFSGSLVLGVSNDPNNPSSLVEFSFELDLPIYPARIMDVKETVTAHDIPMLLDRVSMTPSYTVAYICYPKPSAFDWMTGQAISLQIGEDKANTWTYELLFDSDYGDVGKGPEPDWTPPITSGRCIKVGFPVGHHDKAETLILTVNSLEQSIPEVIDDTEVKKAQAKLEALGIEMDYVTFSGNGGGGGGPVFNKLPSGMSQQTAYREFMKALGYVYEGPWVFTFNLEP